MANASGLDAASVRVRFYENRDLREWRSAAKTWPHDLVLAGISPTGMVQPHGSGGSAGLGSALVAGTKDLVLVGIGYESSNGGPATKADTNCQDAEDDEDVDGKSNIPAAADESRGLHDSILPRLLFAEGDDVHCGRNDVCCKGGQQCSKDAACSSICVSR